MLITYGSQRVNTNMHCTRASFLLSAWLNFNIPIGKELLHNDDSKSEKQILMFSSGHETTDTENVFLTKI